MSNSCLQCKDQLCDTYVKKPKNKCMAKCQIFSRVCGYFRPVVMPSKDGKKSGSSWNLGKVSEYNDRKEFVLNKPIAG